MLISAWCTNMFFRYRSIFFFSAHSFRAISLVTGSTGFFSDFLEGAHWSVLGDSC